MPIAEKMLTPHEPVDVDGRIMKTYHVTTDDAPIPEHIVVAAMSYLPTIIPPTDDEAVTGGFLVLHRGGDGAVYLSTYSWVWENVISAATAFSAQPVLGSSDLDPTHFMTLDRPWIGCIWELPPLEHERSAWVRHILEPERSNLDAYLADTFRAGLVGRPTT